MSSALFTPSPAQADDTSLLITRSKRNLQSLSMTRKLSGPIAIGIILLLLLGSYEVIQSYLSIIYNFPNSLDTRYNNLDDGISPTLHYDDETIESICNETLRIVGNVFNEKSMNNHSDNKLWSQDIPFIFLDCEQLVRSVDGTYIPEVNLYDVEPVPRLSLIRLASKLERLEQSDENAEPLKVVVIGGSMSTGIVDIGRLRMRDLAWPQKLMDFLYASGKWPLNNTEVINLSVGGANEEAWLGDLDRITAQEPIDVVLVESAVNDQCNYHEQDTKAIEVNQTSHSLLRFLTRLPSKPAVFSVELFRISYNNTAEIKSHCPDHGKEMLDPALNLTCYYCDQWWRPQDWRISAREHNSFSYISYRNAVWLENDSPPDHLCQYWSGLSHPQSGVHVMVVSTVLFQFLLVYEKRYLIIKEMDQKLEEMDLIEEKGVCLNPISSFHAIQGDSIDQMHLDESNGKNKSCWEYRVDSKDKYGWICEVNTTSSSDHIDIANDFLLLQQKIHIGKQRLVVVTRLVSYDSRMATAQIWFTDLLGNSNVFVNDPIWNVTSWHAEETSIPQPYLISLDQLELKSSMHIMERGRSEELEVLFNIRLLSGSASSVFTDKFKLLGIVSC